MRQVNFQHRSPHILKLLIASAISLGTAGCVRPPLLAQITAQSSPASPASDRSANADVEALVAFGPRVAGTPVMEQASDYLLAAYRQAGYVTEVQTFTYSKFEDHGSTLTLGNSTLAGRALNNSVAGNLTARLVAVPNVGRTEDFAQVDVQGAIAIVRRGEIRFSEKASNAAAAGAIGLVIVNTESGNFPGALDGETSIPVLSLSSEQGRPLLEQAVPEPVTLNVNTAHRTVTGRNIIAHLVGVTQPEVVLGAHYDSVAGSPGANDNASGTAVVLAIARHAANRSIARQAWFVAFDGEEDGLHGSSAFVREADPQFLAGLEGMLNFDMVGVNDELQAIGADSLTAIAKAADSAISTAAESEGSDHVPFAIAEVPTLFFTRGLEPNYHSPRDRQVDPQLLNKTTEVAIDVMEQLLTN